MSKKDKSISQIVEDVLITEPDNKEEILECLDTNRTKASNYMLRDTVESLVKLDSNNIKRYLGNDSNIAYQRDFEVTDLKHYEFESDFNRDSQFVSNTMTYYLLVISDFLTDKYFTDYYIDVYIDGRMINRDYIMIDPDPERFKFEPGSKRIFINSEIFNDLNKDETFFIDLKEDSIISVVGIKKPRLAKSFKKYIMKDDYRKEQNAYFPVYESQIGYFMENTDNIMVFKKYRNNSNFIPMVEVGNPIADNEFCFLYIKDKDDKEVLNIKIFDVANDDEILIVNKLHQKEIRIYDPNNDITDKEYMKDPLMEVDLSTLIKVGKEKLNVPLPVESIDELDVFINGFRLIPEKDFNLYKSNITGKFKIEFTGIPHNKSEIIIRNRAISKKYDFYKRFNNIQSKGFKNLSYVGIPLDNNYIEAYVSRRRVPLAKRKIISDTIILVEDQDTLRDLEVVSYFNNNDVARSLLEKYKNNKPVLTELSEIFLSEVLKSYELNNPITKNRDGLDHQYTRDKVFKATIKRIRLFSDRNVLPIGYEPTFTVIGYTNDEDEIAIDLTNSEHCSIFPVDNADITKAGFVKYKATYMQGNDLIESDEISLEYLDKKIMGLKIDTVSNFYLMDDDLSNEVKFKVIYEDYSEKYLNLGTRKKPSEESKNFSLAIGTITSEMRMSKDIFTELEKLKTITEGYEGIIKIKAQYGEVIDEKSLVIMNESDRKITGLTVNLSNQLTNKNTGEAILEIIAKFNNDVIQKIPLSNIDYDLDTEIVVDNTTNKISNLELDKEYMLNILNIYDKDISSDKKKSINIEDDVKLDFGLIIFSDTPAHGKIVNINGQIASLDRSFIDNPGKYAGKYYSINRMNKPIIGTETTDDIYSVTLNKVPIDKENIVFGLLEEDDHLNEYNAVVEFYDKVDDETYKFIDFEIFTFKSLEDNITIPSILTGNLMDGFKLRIPKKQLLETVKVEGKEISDIIFEEIKFKHINGDHILGVSCKRVETQPTGSEIYNQAPSPSYPGNHLEYIFEDYDVTDGSVQKIYKSIIKGDLKYIKANIQGLNSELYITVANNYNYIDMEPNVDDLVFINNEHGTRIEFNLDPTNIDTEAFNVIYAMKTGISSKDIKRIPGSIFELSLSDLENYKGKSYIVYKKFNTSTGKHTIVINTIETIMNTERNEYELYKFQDVPVLITYKDDGTIEDIKLREGKE